MGNFHQHSFDISHRVSWLELISFHCKTALLTENSQEFIVIECFRRKLDIHPDKARTPAAVVIRIINRARKRALIEGKLYGRD